MSSYSPNSYAKYVDDKVYRQSNLPSVSLEKRVERLEQERAYTDKILKDLCNSIKQLQTDNKENVHSNHHSQLGSHSWSTDNKYPKR
jgi:hypothetical protein